MTRRAILVTGGAGFVGAQTCKALHQAGFLPVTLDDFSTGYRAAVRWGPLVEGNIRDQALVRQVVQTFGIEGTLHFAASSVVGESMMAPAKYYANNLAAATEFLTAIVEAGVSRFVFSSTAAVYGRPHTTPISEAHTTGPLSPYGATKLAFEAALAWFEAAYGLQWTALRYFNAAGADLDGEVGESHEPETHLIPLLCRALASGGGPITIYGEDYDTADGTCVRDYVHVVDLAQAHVLALRALLDGNGGGIYNVGSGDGVSVREIIAAASKAFEARVTVEVGPRRPGDPAKLVADTSRLRAAFGWKPQHSDLATILKSARHWQVNRLY